MSLTKASINFSSSTTESVFSVFLVFPLWVFLSLNCFFLTFDSFLSDVIVVFSHSSPCHDHGDHSRWPSAPWLHYCPPHHLHRTVPPSQCALLVERCLCMLLPLTNTALYCMSFNWLHQATVCLLCGHLGKKTKGQWKLRSCEFHTVSCELCISTNICFHFSLNKKALNKFQHIIVQNTGPLDYALSSRLWPDRRKPQQWRTTVFVF